MELTSEDCHHRAKCIAAFEAKLLTGQIQAGNAKSQERFPVEESWQSLGGSDSAASFLKKNQEEKHLLVTSCTGDAKTTAEDTCAEYLGEETRESGSFFDDCVFDVCRGGELEALKNGCCLTHKALKAEEASPVIMRSDGDKRKLPASPLFAAWKLPGFGGGDDEQQPTLTPRSPLWCTSGQPLASVPAFRKALRPLCRSQRSRGSDEGAGPGTSTRLVLTFGAREQEGGESQARNLRHDPLRGCQESSKDCSAELRELQEGGEDAGIPPCLGEDALDLEDSICCERSWEQQRRLVGLVGRLVVYKDSATLREDFVLRLGLRQSGAVVAMIRCPGLAEKAGIQVGDRLVSVNGKRLQDVADCVSMGVVTNVELPAALVFMCKLGKISSEVRLVSSAPVEMDFTLASDKVWAGARTKWSKFRAREYSLQLTLELLLFGSQVCLKFWPRPALTTPLAYAPSIAAFSPFTMAEVTNNGELSKSARRRAAKKARDEKYVEEAAPPPAPEPVPEKKPKAKAAATPEPKAKAKEAPKAAAKPKAKAKEEPAKPEPKAAAAKGKAAAKAAAAPEAAKPKGAAKADPKAKAGAKAPAPAPAPEPKAQAKGKAKAKAEPAPPAPAAAKAAPKPAAKQAAKAKGPFFVCALRFGEEPENKGDRAELVQPFEMDDGTGGDWEQSTGLSKKAEKRTQGKEKEEQRKREQAIEAAQAKKTVPGMAPTNTVPGMAPAPKAASKEEIAAFMAGVKEKGAAARAQVEAENAEKTSMHTAQIKGSKIKLIQEKTGVTRIDTSGEMFTIVGPQQAVEMAYAAELMEKGYCSMAFEDFKEEAVPVHPSVFPDLIGKGGVTIKAFKSELNVEITIPGDIPKTATTGTKKYKVTLAGKKDDVNKAKQVIENIVSYGYHEITHPGQTHEEIEVEPWAYKFLIGKAGSELRHIQNNYKVKVNIPREHSVCQNVVVVGGPGDVARAKDYIDNVLWKAQNQPTGRRDGDAAIDTWGQEEEEEDGRWQRFVAPAGQSVNASPRQMFSLEQQEAAHLVRRAKNDAEAHLRHFHSEECQASTADVGAQSSNRSGLDESDTSQGVEALDEASDRKFFGLTQGAVEVAAEAPALALA
eukprot:s2200_g8.t1